MELILIRHGEAVENAPGLGDTGRWLTDKGRRVTRKVGRWLDKRSSRSPAEIWSSQLVRAVQSAEIIANAIGAKEEIIVRPELAPSGDPAELVRFLTTYRDHGPIALVGHEPNLSMLARHLLGNVAWPGLKKSGLAAISFVPSSEEGKPHTARFRFLLKPKGLEVIRSLDSSEIDAAAVRSMEVQ